ncbi:response regulator [Oleiphilus messinensis]|uniref:Response regulator n=1 Tax=Oleiphilus messinensis TaxID=141451 RepID=A0A1Y0I7V6_9GAMM|nr:fused response regulator/phosphatase [Oleiphilus messinensis]ARU56279.1 response regulator [Oleiphilus messinensis]
MKVLVVDDQRANRELLTWILEDYGHESTEAENGQEAVDKFIETKPDLVLLDVMMPVMDGYEAARIIKSHAGDQYIPIIFLTAMTDDDALIKCLEAGGDDFLSKPIDEVVLQAKIKAHTRTQELNEQVRKKNQELVYLHNRIQREHEMGEHVLSNAMRENFYDAPNIRHYMSPMSKFNGDLFLVTAKPSGGVYGLLGDFTGHGLAASIGAIPVSQTFFAMTQKNFPASEIVAALNSTLSRFLPDHMFCALTFFELNHAGSQLIVWSGGLPDCYVMRPGQGVVKHIESKHMPLGVLEPHEFESDVEIVSLKEGDRVILYTDGIIESLNEVGDMYGVERLLEIINRGKEDILGAVLDDFHRFKKGKEQDDDISLIELTAQKLPASAAAAQVTNRPPIPWSLTVELTPQEFKSIADPVEQLVSMLPKYSPLIEHRDVLHTIIKELYSNSLEHGMLSLNSDIKMQDDGFELYYQLRGERLSALDQGRIAIRLHYQPQENGDEISIEVQDSGSGYEIADIKHGESEEMNHGRGLMLIRSLCKSVELCDEGRMVRVVYSAESKL